MIRNFYAVVIATVVGACSSSNSSPSAPSDADGGTSKTAGPDGGNGGPDGSVGTDAATAATLTCASHTWCTSFAHLEFGGQTMPQPAGGPLTDGSYRAGYALVPGSSGKGLDDALVLQGSHYLRAGFTYHEVGTFVASGTNITFTPTAECDSETGESKADDSLKPYTMPYSAGANGELTLLDVYNGETQEATIYLPMSSWCNAPSSPGTAPGADSFQCHLANCGCAENTNGASDSSTCNFVDGRSN